MKLNHKDVWNGVYRGVAFEIVNWGTRDKSNSIDSRHTHNWNYYLYLNTNNFTNDFGKKLLISQVEKQWSENRKYKTYEYYGLPLIQDLYMHGGITHFDILSNEVVKIGCDYGHLDDEPYNESITSVASDCRTSIDCLFIQAKEENTEYLLNCRWDGTLTAENDGCYINDDRADFYSYRYIQTMPKEQIQNWFRNSPEVKLLLENHPKLITE